MLYGNPGVCVCVCVCVCAGYVKCVKSWVDPSHRQMCCRWARSTPKAWRQSAVPYDFFLNLSNVSTNSSICHGNDCCDCSGVVVLSCIHIHSLVWRNVLQGSQTSTCNERET